MKDLILLVQKLHSVMKTHSFCFKKMAGIWFIAATLLLSSCYTYRVTTLAQPGAEAARARLLAV